MVTVHHAAKLSCLKQAEAIHLMVRDSGAGFNTETRGNSKGLGLISMQERAKLVNGKFSVQSESKHGTTIHAVVPSMERGNRTVKTDYQL